MSRFILPVCFVLLTFGGARAQSDTSALLTPQTLQELVRLNHPVARQAALQTDRADATLLAARGAFDPKLGAGLDQKYFDDKTYFSLLDAGVKVPTLIGIDVKAGFEQNRGLFLNPESNVPQSGLWYAGLTVPVGQGLFFDERRSNLRQARIFGDLANATRRLLLNDLLYNATKVYWDWFMAYHQLEIYREGLRLAEDRLVAVREYALRGDRPSVDTLEASIQVQNRRLLLQQAEIDFRNAGLELSNFIWLGDQQRGTVSDDAVPIAVQEPAPETATLVQFPDSLILRHPKLRELDAGIAQLEVERRWKREQLKPRLDLTYQPLLEGGGDDLAVAFSPANYKWGFNFGFPLFLRKERGSLQLTQIKIAETDLKRQNIQRELLNQAYAYRNEWQLLQEQVLLYERIVNDYAALLAAERELFNNGESSLFLINSREISYQNARLKLVELVAKSRKALAAVRYALADFAN